jgi:hypothetical protein
MSRVVSHRQETNIWIQLLAGPVIWSAHFLLGYLLVEAFCQMGWSFAILGLNGLSFILIVLTLLAVLGTVLFAVRSYRSWRNINRDRTLRDQFGDTSGWYDGPVEFIYLSGFLLSVLFAATILIVGIPALFLQPC